MKRIPELRDLSDDHHTALVLARRCRRPQPGDDARAVWSRLREAFASHLEPHFAIEEEHLLPALEAIGEPELAERIRAEHALLRARVAEGAGDREALAELGQLLDAHVRFEEREVFEATQHRLPDATLRAIAEACRSVPRTCSADLLV